ncbi:EamA family transporter [candidate division KSB1 bacterium]|nr:EamA family transporter [candidate division KSB1 bacterium]NIR72851.1 EamA family transporter [candidate division KSB1 bacterium]NIS23750.1 EamA family transporter [candidate division KSB1 bacterium]NIT70671.1 EamA family transporter [candidate division KSB1 bacterium]NIU24400.1 EamA family transporter [candidate division KSB1 bacterium]
MNSRADIQKSEKIRAYMAWGAVCIAWGTTYLAIRIGVQALPPALFAGIRFLLAGLIFVTALRFRGYTLPRKNELVDLAVVGVALLAVANGTVVWAEQWIPSGLAALIVATLPFWMVGIESFLPQGDKLSFRKVCGIAIGFLGLVLLLWPDLQGAVDPGYLKGVLVILIAPLSWGAGSIYSKYRKIKTRPLMAAAVQMLIAGIVLTIAGAIKGEFAHFNFSAQGWAALGYLVVFGSLVGYSSYIYALAHLPAAMVSTYAYINPIIAVILGWLVLGERLDWLVAVSTAIILLGVVLVKASPSRKKEIRARRFIPQDEVEQSSTV